MTHPGADERVSVHLPASAQAPAAARKLVRELLVGWDLESMVADASVVASELVTNAVRHAVGAETYLLELVRTDTGIRICVADPSPLLPIVREPDIAAPNGRGMQIINALGAEWGWEPLPDGKRVWVDVAHSADDPETRTSGGTATEANAGTGRPLVTEPRRFPPTVLVDLEPVPVSETDPPVAQAEPLDAEET